jgi:hypothetical protein
MQTVGGLEELRERGRMTWIAAERGWAAAPEDIVEALSGAGFEECKREVTSSRRDNRPAGGLWQGLNPRTGVLATAIWVARPPEREALVFITVAGELVSGGAAASLEPDRDADHHEDGGEG